jgi:hypothetical protein
MRAHLLAGLAAGGVAFAYFLTGRGYPWQLALMVSAGVGALVFSALRSSARLRSTGRRDGD